MYILNKNKNSSKFQYHLGHSIWFQQLDIISGIQNLFSDFYNELGDLKGPNIIYCTMVKCREDFNGHHMTSTPA